MPPIPTYKLDKLGRRRLNSRFPVIGGWLRRSAARVLARELAIGRVLAARYLAPAAAAHDDPRVRAIAREAVRAASDSKCLDVIAGVWAETRAPGLRQVIEEKNFLATSTREVRVLTALVIDRLQPITQGAPSIAAPLIKICGDDDPEIAARARTALGKIRRQDTIDAVCEELIYGDHPRGLQLALDAGYTPSTPHRRALFLFITGQWDEYQDLDFDGRLMRAVYDAADQRLQRRIAGQLRSSGRADLLPLVTGGDRLTRVSRITTSEADFLVDMTSKHGLWDKLWRLVFELPVAHSARALLQLVAADWRPEPADERLIFDQLRVNAEPTASLTGAKLKRALPPALECERLAMPGRVNAAAFSPRRSVLAIGTGNGRVVLWDFHQAERTALHSDFQHSIGCVNFTADDTLVCGERSALRDAECWVVALPGEERLELTRHRGPVTALEPLGGSMLLSGGRDRRMVVLDVAAFRPRADGATSGLRASNTTGIVEEEVFHHWPRSLRVSPNGVRLVVLHNSVTTMSLPTFDDEMRTFGHPHPGVSRCADFAPDGETVIVGKHNGFVDVFRPEGKRLIGEPEALARYPGPVQSVQSLAGRGIVVTAGDSGRVTFTNWDDRRTLGEIIVPGDRLTTLTVSPDGATMAIGDSDASLTLWDLRPLDLPLLFDRPLARSAPGHLAAAAELSESSRIDEKIKPALSYLQDVLKHRFRYDVEIADGPTIKLGEFDIELD